MLTTHSQEKDYQMQLEELHTEAGHMKQHIKNLQDQIIKLQEEADKLKNEIESKILEVKQAHKQASQQLRYVISSSLCDISCHVNF